MTVTLQDLAGVASGALGLSAAIPYAIAATRGTRPRVTSWAVWSLQSAIGIVLMFAGGGGSATWLLVGYLAANLTGLVVAVRFGHPTRLTRLDGVCAAVAVAALVVWTIADAIALAIAGNIVANAIATVPTLRNAWQGHEPTVPWLMTSAAAYLSVLSLTTFAFAAAAMPVYFALANTLVLALAVHGRQTRPD